MRTKSDTLTPFELFIAKQLADDLAPMKIAELNGWTEGRVTNAIVSLKSKIARRTLQGIAVWYVKRGAKL